MPEQGKPWKPFRQFSAINPQASEADYRDLIKSTGTTEDTADQLAISSISIVNSIYDNPVPITTKGDLATWDTALVRLPVGANHEFLEAQSAETTGLKWRTGNTTKGDLLGFDTTHKRVPVGTNGKALLSDSSQDLGVKWVWSSGLGLLLKGGGYDGALTLVADASITAANCCKSYSTVELSTFTLTVGSSGTDASFGLIYADTINSNGGMIVKDQSNSSTYCHLGGAGAGGGGGGGAGGAGNFGGMSLWIYCKEITGTGTIRVNGGAGVAGSNATIATATANGSLGTAPGSSMQVFGELTTATGSNSGGTGGQSAGTGGSGTASTLNPDDGDMAAIRDILCYISPGGWNNPTDTVGIGPVTRWFRFPAGGGGHSGGRNNGGAQGAGGGGAYARMPGPWGDPATGAAGGAGAAGGSGAGGGGGGGGGHGGILILFAMSVASGWTLQAAGGAGGNGGAGFDRGGGGAGGHGGHGGTIILCTAYGTTCTTSVAGGAAGNGGAAGALGGNPGSNGSDGTAGRVFTHTWAGA